ncbi:centromere protein K isoform X3 [Stegostoma tigrinum]|uniref:centromere protein K isoform X3 n=1 Tax=Stegostoma tigrinum TaxID=3053191 RepID=UPI00287058D6|nr:centromere protein K isoform X3 [Stegostoma tigrinum]
MILSCVRAKKKSLQEELEREQKWLDEQLELEKTVQERFDHQPDFRVITKNRDWPLREIKAQPTSSRFMRSLSSSIYVCRRHVDHIVTGWTNRPSPPRIRFPLLMSEARAKPFTNGDSSALSHSRRLVAGRSLLPDPAVLCCGMF